MSLLEILEFGEKTIRSIADENKAYVENQADGAQLTDMTDSAAEDAIKIRLAEDKLLDIRPGNETQEYYITHHNIEGKTPRERVIINIA